MTANDVSQITPEEAQDTRTSHQRLKQALTDRGVVIGGVLITPRCCRRRA